MNMICSRCKQRPAIVFVSKMDGDKHVNEGYCLKCAKEIGIPHVQEMIEKLGLEYNRARQSAITQEITEIVAGSGT